MDKLWAPWRIKYITGTKRKGCIFCQALKSKNDSRSNLVYRSKYCFAILNTFPYNNGHLMVVPNRHTADMSELKDEELLDLQKTQVTMLSALKLALKPAGFNVGINLGKVAGAGIAEHMHIHVVPRWESDTNFMPIVSDTKIISQSLQDLYKLLRKHIKD